MGLTWSNVTVKNGCLIVCFTNFPTNDNLKNDVWSLWKEHKEAIKSDGFSIGKDPKTGAWKINYFHNVNDTTYEKTVNGEFLWKHHFNTKLAKWTKKISDARENTSITNEDDDDGDTDVDPEFISGILKKYT